MAVQVSKSGGIYIEISGDYSQLQKDLQEVRRLGSMSANEISNAFKGAVSPADASRIGTNLARAFKTAENAAQGLKADLSSFDKHFRNMGRAAGIAEKDLQKFATTQVKALEKKNADAFVNSLRTVQRQTGMTNAEMNKLAKSLGGVGNEFNKASSGIKVFGVELGTALKGASIALIAKKAAELAKESFDLAARYETLGVVVQQVGKVAGYSAIEIDKNVSALRRMGIAGIEARKTLTQLIQSQVDITKTPGLARIAQDAAVIGGINSSESFERMVHGIQAANTQVLRGIGINVNFEQSYAKLAASLGKTTSELTEQEKVQARVNAVMEAGENITGAYEASMATLGKQMNSLSRVFQDLSTDFGKFFVDASNATGGVKGITIFMEGMNANILALRGAMAGLSLDELAQAGRSGGLQGLRDLVEGVEAATDEAKRFEAQLAAVANKLTVSDTTFFQNQLAELKKQFDAGTLGANSYRRSINDLMASLRSLISLPAADAPQADVLGIQGMMQGLREKYGKTDEAKRQKSITDAKEQLRLLRTLKGEFSESEYSSMTSAFQSQLDKLTKGSRTASAAIERTSYQAAQAYKDASDALTALTMRTAELQSNLSGETLDATFKKIERQFETQRNRVTDAIGKLEENARQWAKSGKLDGEAKSNLADARERLSLQLQELSVQEDLEKKLADRAATERELRANMDYAGLIGDVQAYYAEEVKLLAVQMERASAAEKVALAEKLRIAQARASFDTGGMLQTGMAKMAQDAGQRMIDFYEKTIPESIGAVSDTFGTLFADIATGTKSASDSFADMGKTFQSVAHNIISELINMTMRMALFGKNGSDGLLGGLVSGIGGLFGGGASTGMTVTPLAAAKGNVIASPSLSAYSNSIVSSPTVFPFAKGGVGLMGEAGAEAIMPLTRTSTGDLGVQVDLGGGRRSGDTYLWLLP